MAPRLITEADIDAWRALWDYVRSLEPAAYAREHGWTRDDAIAWMADPDHYLVVDPATESAGLFIAHPQALAAQVAFIGTRTIGAIAARNAVDDVLMWFLTRAVARGAVYAYGQHTFPPGVDDANTRALRYFGTLPTVTVRRDVQENGDVVVRVETHDIPGLIAVVEAR